MINGTFYTTAEVARIFGVNRATVARWIRTGKIHGIHTPGGDLRLPAGDVHALTGHPPHVDDNATKALAAVISQHFNTNATAALLALAQLAGIDVAYLDRAHFTRHLQHHHGRALIDEEWKRITGELGEYCNVIDDLCHDTITDYTNAILYAADIIPTHNDTPQT